jgi:hypothetical protein
VSWYCAVYEFTNDQGSIIAGLLALLAGGLAYWAGSSQATATREQVDYMKSAAAESDRRAREDLLASLDNEEVELRCWPLSDLRRLKDIK